MREQLEQRLTALRSEYEKGQTQLRQLESQSNCLRETLLRISGAIMVLEELLSKPAAISSRNGQQSKDVTAATDASSAARNDRHAGINKEV